MSRTLRFTILGIPPGLNVLRRMHHYHWADAKRDWTGRSYEAALEAVKRIIPKGEVWAQKVRVTVTYHFADARRRDPDNYASATKFLLDGLTLARVMPDDDFGHVELVVRRGEPDKRNPHVEVLVEEVE